jgi:hypothetical protein
MNDPHFIDDFSSSCAKWTFEDGRKRPGVPIVFLHIPKCAGQAFRHGLSEALHPSTTLSFFDHSLFGAFDRFETIAPELKASIFGPEDQIPTNADFIGGHFAVSTARHFYPEANYCTVLREPTSRLLSHWLFWRQHSDEDMAPWGAQWGDLIRRARNPLADFLRDPELASQTDNLIVRMLLWPDPRIPADDFIRTGQDEALLKDAIAILRRFEFVDFIENPDCALNLEKWICSRFALKTVNATREASEGFPVNFGRELSAEALALLEERSRLDHVLWREVAARRRPHEDGRAIEAAVLQSNIDHQKFVQEKSPSRRG